MDYHSVTPTTTAVGSVPAGIGVLIVNGKIGAAARGSHNSLYGTLGAEGTRILHSVKPSTNMSKDMCAGNRPNSYDAQRVDQDLRVPAKPRWLLAIPDAISQLEHLDRTLLTRRDIEQLFGVSTARAATLMQTFGAEMTGNLRTLPRKKLLQQLRKHRQRGAFRGEEERRARLVAELQKARLTGVRFKVPAETMSAQLANLPEGVSVARGRIEVRFDGAGERPGAALRAGPGARERLRPVRGARRSLSRRGRGGDGMTTEALVPAAAEPAAVTGGGGDSPPFSKALAVARKRVYLAHGQPRAVNPPPCPMRSEPEGRIDSNVR